MSQSLGDLLLASGTITASGLREAQALQRGGSMDMGQALIHLKLVDELTLTKAKAKEHGMPFVDIEKGKVRQEILDMVPSELASEQGIVPLMLKGGKLVVAIDDPFKRIFADQLQFSLDCEVACALAVPSALKAAVARYYGASGEDEVAARMRADKGDDEDDAPIIRLVSNTFAQALEQRASDIHVEPGHGRVRIRFRIDGMLRDIAAHPEHLAAPLMSRLKIMAEMDIAEKRKPQDGRMGMRIKGRDIDVRASILPSNHGESMVMRLLDRSANLLHLRDLGFSSDDYAWFKRVIAKPNGICLVTGPTGSGKTTTLYAALAELNRPDVKIITAEDPVEYHIQGINQVQVSQRVGLTFARILKAMLRCAPNIILVGEIRDLETAEIAIQAALTGHLVFSTIHTNDAPGALTRLIDLGVKPFLVSASVQAAVAQRLVRRLCPECSQEYKPDPGEFAALGLEASSLADRTFRRPAGCRACDGSGYRGRIALYEMMEMNSTMRDMTFRGSSLEEIRAGALSSGALRALAADGARKVLEGLTSVTEVLRVVGGKS